MARWPARWSTGNSCNAPTSSPQGCDEFRGPRITASIQTKQRGLKSMKTLKLLALAVTLTCGAAALADVEEKREMKIVIGGASSDDSATFHWTSDEPGFDMESMQVGETQSIVDESGRSVLITREAEGFRFDVDGETVVIPDMGAHGAHLAFVDGFDFSADFDLELMGDHQVMSSYDASADHHQR